MKKYILSAVLMVAAATSFSQSRTVQEFQFANAPQQFENQLITIQNVEVSFEPVAPHMQNKDCKVPKSFESLEVNFKGGDPNFKPCFLVSKQMKMINAQKVGGRKAKFDITFKGSQASGYVVSIMIPKG
jgi:hypothetical protein